MSHGRSECSKGAVSVIDDELKGAVALIFRRKAKDLLTDKEFVFSASMDLRWFNYSDAMRFLDLAIERGFLKREGKALLPTFDHRKLELPAAFRPSPDIVREGAAAAEPDNGTLFLRIVDRIARNSKQDRSSVISRINKKRENLRLDAEVLALLVAKEDGIDVSPYVEEAENVVRERIAQNVESGSTDRDEKEEE